jgi:CheY-like chemotaxis protein
MRPPEIPLGITASPARLLAGLILLAAVAVAALAWRRARAREAVNAPLQRLRGFHIFGPDEDEDSTPVHIPLLGRRIPDGEEPAPLRVPVIKAPSPVRREATPNPAVPAATVASATAPPAPEPRVPAAIAASAAEPPKAVPVPQTRLAVAASSAATAPMAAPAAPTGAARPPAVAPPTRTVLAPAPPVAPRPRPGLAPAPPVAASPAAPPNGTVAVPAAQPPKAAPPVARTAPAPTATAPRRPRPAKATSGDDTLTPANAPDLHGRDILLVEDDDTIATMYVMLLGTKGYSTRHARDGVEGIAMVRKERPALILLDMLMPRMDGLEVLEALRGWPKTSSIPVVVLSNVADRAMVDRALALGAVEYLIKAQTRPQVLIGALPHWLRGNRALTA